MKRRRYLLLLECLVVFLLVFLVDLERSLHDSFVLGQEESQPDSLVLKSQTFNSNDGGWEELSSSLVQVVSDGFDGKGMRVTNRASASSGMALNIDKEFKQAYKDARAYFYVEFWVKLAVADASPFDQQTICATLDYEPSGMNDPENSFVNLQCLQLFDSGTWTLLKGEASTGFINFNTAGAWIMIYGPDGVVEAGTANIEIYMDEFLLTAYDISDLFEGCDIPNPFSNLGQESIQVSINDDAMSQDLVMVPSDHRCFIACEEEEFFGTEACGINATCHTGCIANAIYQCQTSVSMGEAPTPVFDGLRILPLGDSITDGWNFPCGFRGYLKSMLLANVTNIRYQGSTQTCGMQSDQQTEDGNACGADSCASLDSYDHHEGWPGKQTHEIEDLLHTTLPCRWGSRPHIILVCSGTNDFLKGNSKPSKFSTAPDRILNLLRKISLRRPGSKLILGTIPPLKGNFNSLNKKIMNFNEALKTWVLTEALSEGIDVILADTGNFDKDIGIQADGIHPTKYGYTYMAMKFYDAIMSLEEITPFLYESSQFDTAPMPIESHLLAPASELPGPVPIESPDFIPFLFSVPEPATGPVPAPNVELELISSLAPVSEPTAIAEQAPSSMPPQSTPVEGPFAAAPSTASYPLPPPLSGNLCKVASPAGLYYSCIADIDNSGDITVLDAVAIVGEVLSYMPGDQVDLKYDANQDGEVNVIDPVIIIGLIIGG